MAYKRTRKKKEQENKREYSQGQTRSFKTRPPINNVPPDEPPFTARVGNLNFKVTEDDLREFFKELGIKELKLVLDRNSRVPKSRGYAFIEFNDKEGLVSALEANNFDFMERPLEVSVYIRRTEEGGSSSFGNNRYGSGKRPNFDYNRNSQNDQDQPSSRERKKLQINQRTLPLEDRHIHPGKLQPEMIEKEQTKGEGEQQTREDTQQPKTTLQETSTTSQESRVRENPFGNATPVTPVFKDKIKQEQPEDDKFKKPFQKHFGNVEKQRSTSYSGNTEKRGGQYGNNKRYNNNRREGYNNSRENEDGNGGRTEWGVRGKSRQGKPGGFNNRGGGGGRDNQNGNKFPLNNSKPEESKSNNPLQGNMYGLLFDENDPQVDNEVEEKND